MARPLLATAVKESRMHFSSVAALIAALVLGGSLAACAPTGTLQNSTLIDSWREADKRDSRRRVAARKQKIADVVRPHLVAAWEDAKTGASDTSGLPNGQVCQGDVAVTVTTQLASRPMSDGLPRLGYNPSPTVKRTPIAGRGLTLGVFVTRPRTNECTDGELVATCTDVGPDALRLDQCTFHL
jgi:hypothetical protein